MKIVGYTHSDGYALCPEHSFETVIVNGLSVTRLIEDRGNEYGTVQPIWDTDKWDNAPSCDVCLKSLDVEVIEYKPKKPMSFREYILYGDEKD